MKFDSAVLNWADPAPEPDTRVSVAVSIDSRTDPYVICKIPDGTILGDGDMDVIQAIARYRMTNPDAGDITFDPATRAVTETRIAPDCTFTFGLADGVLTRGAR